MSVGRTMTVVGGLAFLATGCATSFGAKAKENEALKTQVASLEGQVSTLTQRMAELSQKQGALETQWQNRQQAKQVQSLPPKKAASSLSNRQIQLALKATGFYAGPIDGKLGSQTREAIKAFQRSNQLTPDGMVGAKTSLALAKHLEHGGGGGGVPERAASVSNE